MKNFFFIVFVVIILLTSCHNSDKTQGNTHSTEKSIGRPVGRPYVNVFGTKVYLNAYEVNALGTSINIHYE